jgi:chondroitin sulfate synthase
MHDHYIENFEWFMRADDDVFIKGDKIEKFLRSINSSTPQFIGQAGMGKKEEIGKLNFLYPH